MNRCWAFPSPSITTSHACSTRTAPCSASPPPLKSARPGDTVLGWRVTDITAAIRGLAARGVVFLRYEGMDQDSDGVWTAPGGDKVAWFTDPDGNVLSLTQFV